MRKKSFFKALFLPIILLSIKTTAEPIYSWKDEKGRVHFSNKAADPSAKIVDLPPITKEQPRHQDNLDQNTEASAIDCSFHDGIDCEAGADIDGSVICKDGFKETSKSYQENCQRAKLSTHMVEINPKKDLIRAIVRNERPVKAESVLVTTLLGEFYRGDQKRFNMTGPQEIESYSDAEYELNLKGTIYAPLKELNQDKLKSRVNANCANC
ncbi:MAG TPA: DUF4124 domain-containing protein [Oligoflexia bacterium]|nr:DUF4124 domain-containing protein [Oligoflexia bacterium]HMP26821.1 DUF4124 domain-containing protein [Oligoflexia bacterium]